MNSMSVYNSNSLIINKLLQLINQYQTSKNEQNNKGLNFKIISFRKAINNIKEYKYQILSVEDLNSIKGVGDGLKKRIQEILETGTLEELQEMKKMNNSEKNEELEINEIENLKRITGIGESNATKLIKKNVTLTILLREMEEIDYQLNRKDEKESLKLLTHHQLIGLKYFKDLEIKIPRNEIIKLDENILKYKNELDETILYEICGSYRREASFSGDIDILISNADLNKDNIKNSNLLTDFVKLLIANELIVDNLTKFGKTKYMGVCKLNADSIARRIDIRCIPYESYIPAILYFTGNKNHNVKMRKLAIKNNYKLNEYGLFRKDNSEQILLKNEKEIYNLFNIEYVEPKLRLN